jgi:hypothetical protein
VVIIGKFFHHIFSPYIFCHYKCFLFIRFCFVSLYLLPLHIFSLYILSFYVLSFYTFCCYMFCPLIRFVFICFVVILLSYVLSLYFLSLNRWQDGVSPSKGILPCCVLMICLQRLKRLLSRTSHWSNKTTAIIQCSQLIGHSHYAIWLDHVGGTTCNIEIFL